MAAPTPTRRVVERLEDLRARGAQALAELPDPERYREADRPARRDMLDGLRPELYALSALLSGAVVARAVGDRGSFPPYGLARSKFSGTGMVRAFPPPYEEGAIDNFHTLWTAFVDTTVLHLQRELTARQRSAQGWTVQRLGLLLRLFAGAEEPGKQVRKRDPMSFIYGGLQFGTSVCVQLAEVGARTLRRHAPGLDAAELTGILARSTGPAYRLAVLGLDQALSTYEALLSSAPDTPEQGRDKPGWMDAGRFVVQESHGVPWRVVLRDDEPSPPPDDAAYTRLGCPARIAAEGEQTPIGALWLWCVEVAGAAGLLAPSPG